MAERDRGSDDPQLGAIARHALHDEELVVALAAGDIEDQADIERARSLVERCQTCRDIHQDVTAIRAAVRASGSAAQRAEMLVAPRDFRLTLDDASRLRPGTPVARLAARLGWRARLGRGVVAFGRPVGAAMATFGVVGLLVGSVALGGQRLATVGGPAAAPSAAGGFEGGASAPASSGSFASYGPLQTARDRDVASGGSVVGGGAAGTIALLAGSLALVILGIGLIVAARRGLPPIPTQQGN